MGSGLRRQMEKDRIKRIYGRFLVGMGDAFRVVAQALMGGTQDVLNRDTERQKQAYLLQSLAAQSKGGLTSPLEQEKLRAEINNLNRRNNGDGDGKNGKLDSQIESLIQQEEVARGKPFDSSARATIKRRLLEGNLIKLSGNSLGNRPDLEDPFSNIPTRAWRSPLLKMQGGEPTGQPQTPSTSAAPSSTRAIQEAKDAISRGADPLKVKARLQQMGIQAP